MRKTEASKFRPLAQVLPYNQERVSKDMGEALLEAAMLTTLPPMLHKEEKPEKSFSQLSHS